MHTWRFRPCCVAISLTLLAGCGHRESGSPGAVYDAGTFLLENGGTITHTFEVANPERRTVRVVDTQASCACTEVSLSSRTIPAHGKARLSFSTRIPAGYARREIVCAVRTDSEKNPVRSYRLRYESFPRCRFVTSHLQVPEARPVTARVELFTRPGEPIPEIVELKAPKNIRAEIQGNATAKQLDNGILRYTYHVRIALDELAPKTPGPHSSELFLTTTTRHSAILELTWKHPLEYYTCTPLPVHFGIVGADHPRSSKKVLVRSSDGKPFRILEVRGQDDRVRVSAVDAEEDVTAPQPSHALELTLAVEAAPATDSPSGVVFVRTDNREHPMLSIPWAAFTR